MKNSMWILKKELKKYSPESVIRDGGLNLRTVRFMADGAVNARDILYVGTVELKDSLGGKKKQVVCVNRNDFILLDTEDALEVHNELMDIFERYDQWERNLQKGLLYHNSLQTFLDVAAEFMCGPVCLVDTSFYIHAKSDIGGTDVNVSLFLEKNTGNLMKATAVRMINGSSSVIWDKQTKAYVLSDVFPGIYGALRNLYHGEEHEGWLSHLRADRSITQAELDLMDILGDILEQWFKQNRLRNELRGKASVFLELLNNENLDEESVKLRIQRMGMTADSRYVVYSFCKIAKDAVPVSVLERNLNLLFNVVIGWRGNQLLLIRECKEKEVHSMENSLTYILKNMGWGCGCSNEFYGVMQLKEHVPLAVFASAYATEECCIKHFKSVGLKYCIAKLWDINNVDIRHPAILKLQEYDEKKGTDLYHTLKTYLFCERNLVQTAKLMNVHRNSIVYRIDRIFELTELNLEDFDERFYLQISYLLEREDKSCS